MLSLPVRLVDIAIKYSVVKMPASNRVAFLRKEAEADLQFAANAAAYFSKAKKESKAEVVYAFVKDLKKPKGARPGQVSCLTF